MKILFLAPTPFFTQRGTPIDVLNVIKRLSDRGHEVDLLTFPIGKDIKLPGIKIIRCGDFLHIKDIGLGPSLKKLILDLAIFFKFLKLIVLERVKQNRRYDCIHSLDELTFGCWLLGYLINCPVIYDMDSSIVEQFEANTFYKNISFLASWIEKKMINTASIIVPVCDSLAARIEKSNPSKSLIVLYDMPNINMSETPNSAKFKKFNHNTISDKIILYVGNLGKHQGVEHLIKAFTILKNKITDAKLVIAGGNKQDIKALSKLDRDVIFLGPVEPADLSYLYNSATVLVSPRTSGTNTPMKIYDYMASGKVIVATKLLTHTQLLDDDCAILCSPSPKGIEEALRKALTNIVESQKLGSNAKKKLEEKSNPELFSNRLKSVYETAIKPGIW